MAITGKVVASVLLGAAALIMFVLSAISVFLDRSATSAIAAAVALTFILLMRLPILESFEVLTLKVKLRHQVDEADEVLRHVRATASTTSKLLYLQLGFMNRMGSVTWSQKRELLSEVDGMLAGLGIPSTEIEVWKRPFMNLIARDFASILWSGIEHVKRRHRQTADKAIQTYMQNNKPLAADDERYAQLRQEAQRFSQTRLELGDVLQSTELRDIANLTQRWIDVSLFDQAELRALNALRQEIIEHVDACWSVGNITEEAEKYLERVGHKEEDRVQELLSAESKP